MENNNWEKEFSKLAMDAEVTPPEQIWTNIEKSMDKAKKGRRMFPGIFLGGLILIMFVFAFVFRDKLFTNMMSHANNADSIEQENAQPVNTHHILDDHSSELNHQSEKAKSEFSEYNPEKEYYSINNNASYSLNSGEKVLDNRENSATDLTSESTENVQIEGATKKGDFYKNVQIQGSQKVKTTYLNSHNSNRTSKFEGNISTLTASEVSTSNLRNLETKAYQAIYDNKNLLEVSPFECASFKLPRKPKFYADIEAGIGFSSKIISPKSFAATDYMGVRNQSERVWYNAGGAVHVGSLWSNITLDVGLEYFQINEVFTGNTENETRITINIIEDNMGNVIGRDTVAEISSRQMVSRNSYRQYVLPVRFGYFQSIEKISMGVNFGAAYAFSTQMEGIIFDSDGSYYDINKDEKQYFNKDGYWKIIAGVYLGYRTGKNMEIYLRPQFSLDQRSMDRIASPVSQNFNSIQVFGGIRYFLQ